MQTGQAKAPPTGAPAPKAPKLTPPPPSSSVRGGRMGGVRQKGPVPQYGRRALTSLKLVPPERLALGLHLRQAVAGSDVVPRRSVVDLLRPGDVVG